VLKYNAMGIRLIITGMLVGIAGGQVLMEPTAMPLRLSEYHIFEGKPTDLKPAAGFEVYDLATTLFTDYAEKQRLIRLPSGRQLQRVGDGLPVFPEGTLLVKTFYYYNDKQDMTRGKRLIETRVMVLSNGQWVWGTYLWDDNGTEAMLSNTSSKIRVGTIQYVVPSHADCAKCHNSAGTFMPLGPTIRNLRLGTAFVPTLPAWQDSSYTLRQRVGAYLEVNCAHCHNPDGFCARSGLDLRWGAALTDQRALRKMVKFMRKGRMPLIGTTIVHEEGVALLEEYLKNLSKK
jgi:mono/diheme cytochrome c family protein